MIGELVPDAVERGRLLRDLLVAARANETDARNRFGDNSDERRAAQQASAAALIAVRSFNEVLHAHARPKRIDTPSSGDQPATPRRARKPKPIRRACERCSRNLVPMKNGQLPAHYPAKRSNRWCKGGAPLKANQMDYVDAMDRLSFYKIRS